MATANEPVAPAATRVELDERWKYAEKAMTWYGWGSPVGLGLFLIEAAAAVVLIRFAIWPV